jgi:hypothetical protein
MFIGCLRTQGGGGSRDVRTLLAAVTLLALMTSAARADGVTSVAVSDVTAASSPIGIYQSGFFLSGSSSNSLWIAYANRSHALVARFQVHGSWVDAAGAERASFSTVVSTVIGPGERTTATIGGLSVGPPGTALRIDVDRVRFGNLALWTPPIESRTTEHVTLNGGTTFDVLVAADADSESARDGDPVPFVVEHDVEALGITVIARDAVGIGHLESVGRASNWGRSGSLRFVADSVGAVDGSTVYLEGGLHVAPPRVRLPGVAVLGGMFVKGHSADLLLGSPVSVVCSRDVDVSIAAVNQLKREAVTASP